MSAKAKNIKVSLFVNCPHCNSEERIDHPSFIVIDTSSCHCCRGESYSIDCNDDHECSRCKKQYSVENIPK